MRCRTDGGSSKSESVEKDVKHTTAAKKVIKKSKRPACGGVKKTKKRQLPVIKMESFDNGVLPEPNVIRGKPRSGDSRGDYGPYLESLKRLSPLPFEEAQHGDAPSLTSFDYNTFCDFGLIDNDPTQPSLTDEQDDSMNGFNTSHPAPSSCPELFTGITFNGDDICHSPVTKRTAA